jgi:hypothetical protein
MDKQRRGRKTGGKLAQEQQGLGTGLAKWANSLGMILDDSSLDDEKKGVFIFGARVATGRDLAFVGLWSHSGQQTTAQRRCAQISFSLRLQLPIMQPVARGKLLSRGLKSGSSS